MSSVFLVDNLFSDSQYPAATLSANEEASGREAWRVGDGRRSSQDYWSPTTANNAAYVEVDLGAGETATPDVIVIDRGHNLAGKTVLLKRGSGGATTVFTATIPSAVTDNQDIDGANGVLTPEGAWIKRFTGAADRYWRLHVNAMGAGLLPQIVGLWVGTSITPDLSMPVTEDVISLMSHQTLLPSTGWMGRTTPVRQRVGQLSFKLASESAYQSLDAHLRDNFMRGRPMWVVVDDTRAERAVLVMWDGQRAGFEFTDGWWGKRMATLGYYEHEPQVA